MRHRRLPSSKPVPKQRAPTPPSVRSAICATERPPGPRTRMPTLPPLPNQRDQLTHADPR
eukprot:9108314-Alexandrium_andersonii.AAC.1